MSSVRFSKFSNDDFPVFDEDNLYTNNNKDNNNSNSGALAYNAIYKPEKKEENYENGNDFLEDIETKQKLNETIDQINYHIENKSRENSIINYMNTNNEIFLHTRKESIEVSKKKLEDKIYNAIQPPQSNSFLYKYFSYILVGGIILIVFLYLLF